MKSHETLDERDALLAIQQLIDSGRLIECFEVIRCSGDSAMMTIRFTAPPRYKPQQPAPVCTPRQSKLTPPAWQNRGCDPWFRGQPGDYPCKVKR